MTTEKKYINRANGKVYEFVSEEGGFVAFKREGRDTLAYLGRFEFDKRFQLQPDSALGEAARDVLAERDRQKAVEGWSTAHDDQHVDHELSRAAASYAIGNVAYWPWSLAWWKPCDRRRNLVKAGALIIAEIERIDRADPVSAESKPVSVPTEFGEPEPKYMVGQVVEKVSGYRWPGVIVSRFLTQSMKLRYVVECIVPEVAGALHIYSEEQIAPTAAPQPNPSVDANAVITELFRKNDVRPDSTFTHGACRALLAEAIRIAALKGTPNTNRADLEAALTKRAETIGFLAVEDIRELFAAGRQEGRNANS
ncbi:hypothetical protein J2Z19_003223 [Ensifer adhaerens]|uniref:Uncharacterized protein n=1 Tax=Ensifer adhaerens TaxID=106592 RepID=A0ACC5SX87_ENSAD|nr:hypothetical protein [Ensifer adhaerens]MBP1873508.1 hypothetical protein [Ensifer adhaerens]